jgi:hypothetical protein
MWGLLISEAGSDLAFDIAMEVTHTKRVKN